MAKERRLEDMKPQILYKYRDVGEYTEKIFTDKTIWLSKPENLNDPFECSIANFTEKAKAQIVKKYKQIQVCNYSVDAAISLKRNESFFNLDRKSLKKLLKKLNRVSWEKRYQIINEIVYKATGTPLSNPNHIIKSLENRLENIGIFSLSETDIDMLMWTHYANEHKGLALGFEVVDDSILANDRHCLAVNYSDELPKFEPKELTSTLHFEFDGNEASINAQVPFDDPIFRRCVSTKPTYWRYEKEWRYIDETDGLHAFPGKLMEVTFGLRCTEENRLKFKSLAIDNFDYPISFYEIVKIPDTSQIAKQKYN